MYLKKIEISGFKSFPEKVKIEFHKGITSVVGPNGSGKSNISDAIRWALGEQKIKSLRGEKSEDIIFSGTENRRPLSFAQVSLTLDNEDRSMDMDYSEVMVTRRLFRSGESEFMINGGKCRLKDIQELFMDTGVGREGYSIIGQGKIDNILSSRSEDRRKVFDDAAGIAKYKTRKEEAEARLFRQEQNLVRVEDILSELSESLGPLSAQAETAREYLRLMDRLRGVELKLFRIKLEDIARELFSLNEKRAANQKALEDRKEVAEALKTVLFDLKEGSAGIAVRMSEASEELSAIKSEAERLRGEVLLNGEQQANIRENRERLLREAGAVEEECAALSEESENVKSKGEEISGAISRLEEELGAKEARLMEITGMLSEQEALLEGWKTEMIEKIKTMTDIKSGAERLKAIFGQFGLRKGQIISELDGIASRKKETGDGIDALSAKLRAMDERERALSDEKSALEKKLLESETAAGEIKAASEKKEKSLGECASRLKVLSEMAREREGFNKSVKSVLSAKAGGGFEGIEGAVGELIGVPGELEVAVLAALGGGLQNIVTRTEEDAAAAIEYLKRNNLGRATFLPISAVTYKSFAERKSVLAESGVVGVLSELLEYKKEHESVIKSLLGRVAAVEDMKTAIRLSRKYKYSFRIVTLAGEVLNPGGAMTGGSMAKGAANIFGRAREIRELSAARRVLENDISGLLEELREKTAETARLKEALSLLSEALRNLAADRAALSRELSGLKEAFAELSQKETRLESEKSEILSSGAEVEHELSDSEDRLSAMEAEISGMDQKLSSYQKSRETQKAGIDELSSAVTEIRVKLSAVEQEGKAVSENLSRLRKEREAKALELSRKAEGAEDCAVRLREKEEALAELYKSIAGAEARTAEKSEFIARLAGEKAEKEAKIQETEREIADSVSAVSALEGEDIRMEARLEKASEERARVVAEMAEDFEISPDDAMSAEIKGESKSGLSAEAASLKDAVKGLGFVNPDAIERYKEVKARFDFLTAQKYDIIEARKKLAQVIDELTGLMEKQFRLQIAKISQSFNEVFREMFGGGRGEIYLSDRGSVLESGIEITAQPPGKTLQSLTLMSGGERALIAIAILFAILKLRPSPFCVLDEIESALDEANVKRFGDYLKKFAGDTQFIVITHRKPTMEASDAMYGVTMYEKGVSKLVSVRFREKERIE